MQWSGVQDPLAWKSRGVRFRIGKSRIYQEYSPTRLCGAHQSHRIKTGLAKVDDGAPWIRTDNLGS